MKKYINILAVIVLLFSLTSCGMSVSNNQYEEISNYVVENMETIIPTSENQFYEYETDGLYVGGVYYGYYYSENDEILVPDFYGGENLGEAYEADNGTYIGKPNNGTDWCYIRKITDKWFYYELHWA
ncbi:MAG: hypothetical protein ACI4V4_05135 [Eubacterium sp.]